jgi:hypothetical protein
MWNIYDRAQGDLPWTNNCAFKALGSHHANFWKFFNCLQKKEVFTRTQIVQLESGHQNLQLREKYKDLNTQISNIVENYDSAEIIAYLRSISHNIRV